MKNDGLLYVVQSPAIRWLWPPWFLGAVRLTNDTFTNLCLRGLKWLIKSKLRLAKKMSASHFDYMCFKNEKTLSQSPTQMKFN